MNRCLSLLLSILLFATTIGCGQQQDEIRRYKVSKKPQAAADAPIAKVEPGKPSRMLAAIVFEGEQSWFFKLTAAPDNADSASDGFRELLKSVSFVDGTPKWTLPEGWAPKDFKSSIRFATLAVPGPDGVMEFTVTPLPFQGDKDDSLKSNINRWRGQLSLPDLELADLQSSIESIEYDGGVASFVDILGTSKAGSGMGRGGAPFAPFAGGGARRPAPQQPAGADADARPNPKPAAAQLTLTAPDGWTRSTNDQFSAMAYDVDGGSRFTVTRLGGPMAKDLPGNINRWRQQVGLKNLTADELKDNVQAVDIDGLSGSYVVAAGDKKSILGVVLLKENQAWFFKLTGDADAAEAQRENFEQVLETIKFPAE